MRVDLKGLICEGQSKKVSIGRVMLWIVLLFMMGFWAIGIYDHKAVEMPNSLLDFAFALLVYNIGDKAKDVVKGFLEIKNLKSKKDD